MPWLTNPNEFLFLSPLLMPRRPQTTPARREPARRSRTRPTASPATTPETAVLPPAFSLQHLTLEQLGEIRRNTNWRLLFTALGLQRDEHKSRPDDGWARSPFKPDERTASFHMTDAGWFCFSTGRGGGAVELDQHLYPAMNSFDVGRWLLERGISSISGETRSHAIEHLREQSMKHPLLRTSPI